ncbi:MAG: hypothetical protein JSR17_00475 [Proteobacteria bacterium]|nr:hypothetical protein [Pseudomonadota bacterium]
MLEFSHLLACVKSGIENAKSAFLKKEDLATLKSVFLSAATSHQNLHGMLKKFLLQANRLKNPSQFAQMAPKAAEDVIKAYNFNEFPNLLTQYFEEEPNEDEIDDAYLQDAFCLVLSGHLNKYLMRCIAEEENNTECQKSKASKKMCSSCILH